MCGFTDNSFEQLRIIAICYLMWEQNLCR